DISKSMLAEDSIPNRLESAKKFLGAFSDRGGADRVSLVGFGGSAFIAVPLTIDRTAIRTFLDPLNPTFLSDQSTNFSLAVNSCLDALNLGDETKSIEELLLESSRAILIVSDGEETANPDPTIITKLEKL